jgi:hypothetical protein
VNRIYVPVADICKFLAKWETTSFWRIILVHGISHTLWLSQVYAHRPPNTAHFNFKCLLSLSWPAGHILPTYKESFQVRWGNFIPLFLHAAIYLEVYLFRWTSQNAFCRETAVYKWYCVQCWISLKLFSCLKRPKDSNYDITALHKTAFVVTMWHRWTRNMDINTFSFGCYSGGCLSVRCSVKW